MLLYNFIGRVIDPSGALPGSSRTSFVEFQPSSWMGSEKADVIASKFSLAHDNTLRSELSTSVWDSCSVLSSNAFNDDLSSYTSPREISNLIEKLKGRKAPGCDGIPNIFTKRVEARHCDSNSEACQGHSYPSNYHPISLLSSISKILERVILKRLNALISGHNVLPNHQFGFGAAHSTSHQLNRVVRHGKNR
jgi:hypothetical protein